MPPCRALVTALIRHPPSCHSQRTLAGHWVCYIYLRLDCGWMGRGILFLFWSSSMWEGFILLLLWRAFLCQLWSLRGAGHCNSVVSARRLLSRWDNLFTLQCEPGLVPGCSIYSVCYHFFMHGGPVWLQLALTVFITRLLLHPGMLMGLVLFALVQFEWSEFHLCVERLKTATSLSVNNVCGKGW